MMRFFLALVLFTGILLGCKNKSNPEEEFEDFPEGAITQEYPGRTDLVRVSIVDIGGKVKEQGDYLNGKKHGAWTVFHHNGFVKSITSYIDGKKQGSHLELSDRGQLEIKAHYFDDQLHGEYVRYKFTRIKEEKFYRNGKLDGKYVMFYTNGKILEESNYTDGLRDGIARWYDEDGNITIQYLYEMGERIENPDSTQLSGY
jgi:antitoxin component YwqK of YwqJK toxin-antitoxin module